MEMWSGRGIRARGPEVLVAGGRGLVLAVGGFTGAVVLFVLSVVSILLVPVGVGIVTTPGS